jgi:acyl carrier protein
LHPLASDEITVECLSADLRQLEFPGRETEVPDASRAAKPKVREHAGAAPIDYGRIATQFQTAEEIGSAMRQRRREQAAPRRITGTLPQTELQAKLAGIWCDLLGLEAVGIEEDFFDLGGHSLLAVQLLSQINQETGVDLPDSVIYADKLRIDNLARAIELQRLGISEQSSYEAMLAEIESLSDEEVAAMLAEEENRK